MPPTVQVIATGGTIASTDAEGGAEPSLSGEELVAAVPELEEHADVAVEEVADVPSFDMGFDTVAAIGRAARAAADDADGVVVTHGTDTMEESAYHLDLTLDLDVPVVFTGAQRRPDETSPDGPANLLTAVRFAADLPGGGVYVAFDEELHAARDVTKAHTSKLEAFESPDKGPVATTTKGKIRYHREPGSRSASLPVEGTDARVEVVTSGTGVGGGGIDRAVEAGADGIVLQATGIGNATAAIGDAVERAIDAGVPVVVTSRCHAGAVAPVYGTGGGGRTLRDHGAIAGGDRPAWKARVLLALALAASDDPERARSVFEGP